MIQTRRFRPLEVSQLISNRSDGERATNSKAALPIVIAKQ